jgi:hypothetical protein
MGVEMSMPGWKSGRPVKGSRRLPERRRQIAAHRQMDGVEEQQPLSR